MNHNPSEIRILEEKLSQLKKHHEDIQVQIKALQNEFNIEDVRAYRLKKEGLTVKDAMHQVECKLRPNIIA